MALTPKFSIGAVVITPGAESLLLHDPNFLILCIARHVTGDWGDLGDEDKRSNDAAINPEEPARILSAYHLGKHKFWIITEWDRSVTTILLPEEY